MDMNKMPKTIGATPRCSLLQKDGAALTHRVETNTPKRKMVRAPLPSGSDVTTLN
jgi:hypothetical protein